MTFQSFYTYKLTIMSKRKPCTLSIDGGLMKKIKIQAIIEDRTVSDITEQLYSEYLKKKKGKAKR